MAASSYIDDKSIAALNEELIKLREYWSCKTVDIQAKEEIIIKYKMHEIPCTKMYLLTGISEPTYWRFLHAKSKIKKENALIFALMVEMTKDDITKLLGAYKIVLNETKENDQLLIVLIDNLDELYQLERETRIDTIEEFLKMNKC